MTETPKSNKTLNTSIVGSSSPALEVNLNAGRPPQGHSGNLTGNRRILKDSVADVFNNMQLWKEHQDKASIVISNIFNLRMQFPDVRFSDQLKDLVAELKIHCDKMSDIILELDIRQKNVMAVVDLETYNSIRLQTHCVPLFISWSTEQFYQTVTNIVMRYKKQQKLNQILLLKIADSMDSDNLLFYLSSWTFQPYLDHDIEKQIHFMIKETGLS